MSGGASFVKIRSTRVRQPLAHRLRVAGSSPWPRLPQPRFLRLPQSGNQEVASHVRARLDFKREAPSCGHACPIREVTLGVHLCAYPVSRVLRVLRRHAVPAYAAMDSGVAGPELPKFRYRFDSAQLPESAKSYLCIE